MALSIAGTAAGVAGPEVVAAAAGAAGRAAARGGSRLEAGVGADARAHRALVSNPPPTRVHLRVHTRFASRFCALSPEPAMPLTNAPEEVRPLKGSRSRSRARADGSLAVAGEMSRAAAMSTRRASRALLVCPTDAKNHVRMLKSVFSSI